MFMKSAEESSFRLRSHNQRWSLAWRSLAFHECLHTKLTTMTAKTSVDTVRVIKFLWSTGNRSILCRLKIDCNLLLLWCLTLAALVSSIKKIGRFSLLLKVDSKKFGWGKFVKNVMDGCLFILSLLPSKTGRNKRTFFQNKHIPRSWKECRFLRKIEVWFSFGITKQSKGIRQSKMLVKLPSLSQKKSSLLPLESKAHSTILLKAAKFCIL